MAVRAPVVRTMRIPEEEKALILAEWLGRDRRLSQAEFCAQIAASRGVRVRPRTLRAWIRASGAGRVPTAQAQDAVATALAVLRSVERQLEAVLTTLHAGAADEAAGAGSQAGPKRTGEGSDVPVGTVAAAGEQKPLVSSISAEKPIPMPSWQFLSVR